MKAKELVELMHQFKKEVCEKQREICARKLDEFICHQDTDYTNETYDKQYNDILNAPEPE